MPELMTKDSPGLASQLPAPQWGIFKAGQPAATADGVKIFERKKDFNLPTFQIEKGGFANYNKVELPAALSVTYIAGQSVTNRAKLISSIEAIEGSLDLFDVVTPEKTYSSYNIDHVDYHRSLDGGLGVVAIEVWLAEIRIGDAPAFTSTQSPAGAGTQSNGQSQPQTPTGQQDQSVNNKTGLDVGGTDDGGSSGLGAKAGGGGGW